MNEPIPVSLCARAVERAIRDCDAATPGPWGVSPDGWRVFANIDDPETFSHICSTGTNVATRTRRNRANARFIAVAKAGFRASLEYLHADIEHALLTGESLCDAESAAVAPLIDHYDRVAPGWRTE